MITLLLLIIPLIAAILLRFSKRTASSLAEIFGMLELALFIYGLSLYNVNPANELLSFNTPWIKPLSINFHLAWNGLTALLLGISSAVVLLIILSIRNCNYADKNKMYALVFLTQAALIGVFSAEDIFVFYFFFEAALIPVYLIAYIWGGKDASNITFKMLVYTVFGSLFMFVAFVTIYMRLQTSDFNTIKASISVLPNEIHQFIFWAFVLAFAIKMPIFPFHTWLPDAYGESPTPASMLLSGLLSKMGVFGLIKVVMAFAPMGIQHYGFVVIILGVITLIYGCIIAIKQDSMKRLIAYSSFSHMGIMAGAVMTGSAQGLQGAIFQMVAHGFNVVGLFYIAKLIYDRTGSRKLSALGGISISAPRLSVAFLVILLGSIALPLTNGFIGEFLMLKSIFDYNNIIGFIACISVILAAVYMLRYFQKVMYGPVKFHNLQDLDMSEMMIVIPFILAVIIPGIFPNLILHISEPFVNSLNLISK